MQLQTRTMNYYHRNHDPNSDQRRVINSGKRRGRLSSSSSRHVTSNEGWVTPLQSIPEDDLPKIDLTPPPVSHRKRHDTSSTLPPLFPRHNSSRLSPTSTVTNEVGNDDDDDMTPYEMINMERRKRGLNPFRLSRSMNYLATQHAMKMAQNGNVYHSANTIDELKLLLKSHVVAENIQRGDTICTMHIETMCAINSINRSNVVSIYFTEFGYGIATGNDGKVYCCQLFRN